MVGEGAVGELDGGVLALPPHFQPSETHDERPGAGVFARDTDFLLVDDLDSGQLKQQQRRQQPPDAVAISPARAAIADESFHQGMFALQHAGKAQHQPAEEVEREFFLADMVEVLDQETIPADVDPPAPGIGGVEVGGQTKAVAEILRGSPGRRILFCGLPLPAQLLADIRDLQVAGVDLHRSVGDVQPLQAVETRENVLGGDVERGWQPEHCAGLDRFAQLTALAVRADNLKVTRHADGAAFEQDVQPGWGSEPHALPMRIGQLHLRNHFGWVNAMGVAVDEGSVGLLGAKAGDGCPKAFLVGADLGGKLLVAQHARHALERIELVREQDCQPQALRA